MQARTAGEGSHQGPHSVRSFSRLLRGLVLVVHPFPVAVVVLTSALITVIAHGGLPPAGLAARALAVVLLTQVPVGALNDIVDRADDARAQPKKPIPSGLISLRAAAGLTALSLLALVGLLLSFGWQALVLVGTATLGGIAYDLWLKPTPFAVAGYAVGFLLLFTWLWLVAGQFTPLLVALYPGGVLLLLTAHLTQSLPDIESDRALGHHGLAVVLGPRQTLRLVGAGYSAACAVALALSLMSMQPVALALAAAGLVAGAAGWWVGRYGATDHDSRIRFFRVLAPGIAVTALASLLAISHL